MAVLPWQVEVLRFSFLNLQAGQGEQNFSWSSLTSSPPETVSEKRGSRIRVEEGEWLNGNLAVHSQVGRVDVLYNSSAGESPVPNAGQFVEVLGLMRNWYSRFSSIDSRRVAFGGVLLLPVADIQEGYQLLGEFLPFVDFASDMRDFSLQVNRQKAGNGFLANVISKWSCVEIKTLQLTNEGLAEQSSDFALRLEFDINTAELPYDSARLDVVEVLTSLSTYAMSLVSEGAQ
ncbi:hypothetical protein [Pseudomonas sp. BJP69]|uniref:hypothetical protein n=1 Tax=Pseudomonas sp. BJP69 TaxID=2597770 RepID=UPI0011843184|nr:hypothetical protein [Pseudomonas sp. BJP69]QDR67174.1 hypothetical protein FPB55_05635 [Pseudomonas sp. BJP69]